MNSQSIDKTAIAVAELTATVLGCPLKAMVQATTEADFNTLAIQYLGEPLVNAEGEPRAPRSREISVIIADHFLAKLEATRSGIAKINGQLHLYFTDHWQVVGNSELEKALGDFAQALGHRVSDSRHFRFRVELKAQLEAVSPHLKQSPGSIAVNFKNGTLRFDGQKETMTEHDHADGFTYVLPFNFDPNAKSPLFDGYLARVLPDLECRTVLLEFLGWSFLPGLKLEKMLVLHGSGHNGKSVLFDVTKALFGEANISSLSLSSLRAPESRHPLLGKLLNYGSELGGNVSPDILKLASSGEPMEFRKLYGDIFTSSNYARLAFNTNTLPIETEITEGYFRRFQIIPFEESISQEEKDPDLAHKLIENELAGVMNRVLEGMRRVRIQRKFSPCQKSDECLQTYQLESDSVAQFLDDENWKSDPVERVAKGEFYRFYTDYCKDSGFHALGVKNFSSRLKSHYRIAEKKSGRVRSWMIRQV